MEEKTVKQELRRIEPQSLLQSAIEKGASVETLERLLALAKDIRAEQAREAFNRAFAEFQHQCPPITKTKTAKIVGRNGSYTYSYTPLEDIIEKVVPIMTPLGLSVAYRMSGTKDSVSSVAVVTHELGHFKESGEVCMPVTLGGSGANPAQCVGIAATYARRYALLAVTGISPQGEDTDAATPGETNGHSAEKPTPAPAPKQDFLSTVGEIVGTVEKLTSKMSKKNDPYLIFMLNGKTVTVWDKKVFPFITANEGKQIAVVAETKGNYTNLISARPLGKAAPAEDEGPRFDDSPITDDDIAF